jgi:tetratricopeptide (TPR) repeat protein
MRRPHLLLHTLVPVLLLLTLSAAAAAQGVDLGARPHPIPDPHPPTDRSGLGPNPVTDLPGNAAREGMTLSSLQDAERKSRARAALRTADRAYRSGPVLYMIAADAYREAAQLNPKEERAYLGLGNVYSGLKRYDIAARMYAWAAVINPKSAEAHYGLGAAYHAQGKKHEALYELQLLRSLKKELADKLEALLTH